MYYKNWAKLFSSNWAGESCIYRENYESWNEIKFMFYVNPDVMYIVIRSFASGFYAVKKILHDWVCPVLHAFTLHFICSYALSPMHLFILLVRSFICSFARSLFVQSSVCFLFVYSLVCFLFLLSHSFPFSYFFTHSFPLSFSYPFVPFLFHSLCFSHPFVVSVLHSLVRFLLLSLVTSLFCSNFCSQYFTVSLILFFFFSCHPRVVPFSLGLLACLFVRHSVAFWFPDPLSPFLTPSPSSFFSSSVLLSSPLFLFAIFSCWTRKGTYHISILQKDVLLKKFFIKLFIRHTSSMGLLFVFFYLIFTVGGKKPCIGDHFHIWLKSWLAQTTHTPTPWFNRFAFSHRSSDRNKPGPWERDRLIFFLGAVMTDHSRLQVFKFVLSVVNDDVIDIK